MKRTDRLTTLIAALLFLAFAAYAGTYLYRSLTDSTVTAEATAASVSVGGTASGIIVREETVLQSGEKYIDITASDGEKIAAGGQIAIAMSSEAGLERTSRMRELESEIERLSYALAGAGSTSDLSARDEALRKTVLALTGAVARHDFSGLDSAGLSLSGLLLTDGGSVSESELHALEAELKSLQNSSGADTSVLSAGKSGIFSQIVDGYEHITPDDVTHMTPAKIRSLMDSKQEKPDGAFGKLVTDYRWYFAAVMSSSDAENLSVGRTAMLDFGRYYGRELAGRVMSISSPENGSVAVVFRLDEALSDTLAMREASASVAFEQYEGVRVPSQAVHVSDDGAETFVWTITAMQLERKTVNILYTGSDFVIVEREARADALREGNTVVVTGKDLYEGKLME